MKVSTLLTTYNADEFLEPTLRSVEEQVFEDMEILIWDDFSTDKTRQILEEYVERSSYDVRLWFPDENKGAYEGLNKLLQESSGEYIAIQDHDDIWHPEKIRRQVMFLDDNPHFQGCGTARYVYYEALNKVTEFSRNQGSYYAYHTTSMFRNQDNIQYKSGVEGSKDLYFQRYILCDNQKLMANLKEVLVLSRIHEGTENLSERWRQRENPLRVLTKFGVKEGFYSAYTKLTPSNMRNSLSTRLLRRIKTKPVKELNEPWTNYIDS